MNTVHHLTNTFSAAADLPVDLVRVTTSRSIEADYHARAVFPTLRRPPDKAGSSTATVHWCSPPLVEDILTDARQRQEQVRGSCQAAYTTFIKVLEFSINESKKRIEWLSGTEPMLHREDTSERTVYAVPSQFASINLPADLKLPGSLGGPPRRASYKDRAGRLCFVSRAFDLWPTAYQVTVHFTKDEIRERCAKQEAEREAKDSSPKYGSAEAYRAEQVQTFSIMAGCGLPSIEAKCGYAFEPSVIDAVAQKIKEAEYLLRAGKIVMVGFVGCATPSTGQSNSARRPNALRLVHSSAGTTS